MILPYYLRPPYLWLILGIFFLFLGITGSCTGKVWARFGGFVYRAKEPWAFWGIILVDYLSGIFFIGYFLYKVYGFLG